MSEEFTGDKKHLDHFLRPYEEKLIAFFLPMVPARITTVHLTLMTLLWSAGVMGFGYLAAGDIQWLWGLSICIFLQHITDMLDGEVGRLRHTGLVKWGFYMDHFLDYVFMSSIVIGYSFLLPDRYFVIVLMQLVIAAGFMMHVFLDFSITKDLKISFRRFGVSEVRYVLIVGNAALVIFGKPLLVTLFPYITLLSCWALLVVVYQSQGIYRRYDRDRLKHEDKN